jgi:hypothetical protein
METMVFRLFRLPIYRPPPPTPRGEIALEASNYDKLIEIIEIETSRFSIKILGRLISKNKRFWRKVQVTWSNGLGYKVSLP